ncbi:MAG: EAL domain-containing protein [Rhodospirillales bacterium]|nr:EAL domain-containing protein [Rhodospirillales bacterium]
MSPGSGAASRPGHGAPGLAELLLIQTRILRDMAAGRPAQPLAERLCHMVHHYAPDRIASLMRLGSDGKLHPVAVAGGAPAILAAIDGIAPGPRNGSCAAAVHYGTPVLVADARTDPRWAARRAQAASLGMVACWSHPICQGERPIGSFALTGTEPGPPPPAMRRLLEHAAAISGSILQLLDLQENQRRQAERTRRLTGFNAMLAQVNQLAAGRPDTAALYDGICRIAVAQAGLRLAWIGGPDGAGVFHQVAAAGATGFLDEVFVSVDPALPEGRGLSGTAWREARTVVRQQFLPDTMLAPWLESARRFGLGAGAALPLMLHGAPQAILHVYAAEEGVLDDELVGLLGELAVDVGRALEALDQQRNLDRLQALHNALLNAGETLLQARSEAEMLQKTCQQLGNSELFHVTWLARPDQDGVMRTLAGAGPGMARLAEQRLALDDAPPSLVVKAWLAGRTIVQNDLLHDPDLARYRKMFERSGWRSAAAVPILRDGARFAMLVLGSPHPALFTPDALSLCERIAQLLGRSLDEFDLKQALEQERSRQFHLARHDPLTGLPNRLLFEEHLVHALARVGRHGTPLAVCLVDIDDFKPVNDRWGHHAGDAILREAAARLRDTLRRSDLIARLGGDEFVLAIEDLGTPDALPRLLDRLSQAIETPFEMDGGAARVSLSIGVAVFPQDGEDADILLRRADAALYAAKARKLARAQNWQRWAPDLALEPAPAPAIDDPYGPAARKLLAAHAAIWPAVAAGFMDEFYRDLAHQPLAAPIIGALAPEELGRLKARQTKHLLMLTDPATGRDDLRHRARAVGQVHALIGVDGALMMKAVAIYQARLTERLAAQALRPADRQNLASLAIARLHEDIAMQMEARAETVARYFDLLLRRSGRFDMPWVDAARAKLEAIAALPGILIAALMRPDAEGRFEVLASSSAVGLSFADIRRASGVVPGIDPQGREGTGLLGAAWRSGEMCVAASFQTDERTAPWHAAARSFGIRSAAAVPVLDAESCPVAVLILLGGAPGEFLADWMRHFCAGMAERLSMIWRRPHAAVAAAAEESTATAWRQRLFAGGLRLHYQPLVELRDGRVLKVEALARLELEDGTLVEPGRFLPVLGGRDLDELFRLGLSEALLQVARWDAEGLRLAVSVNLPPSTLVRPDCVLWVRQSLRAAGVAPGRLYLEITEQQAPSDADASSAAALAALAGLGVNLAMDDLGSGYSSLERLSTLPFRAVKLDQGLLRGARRAPRRTVSFIGALVQLARDLEIEVVVEGLEDADMVETAAVLGADVGQGYGVGRPMPPAEIPAWVRDFRWTVDRRAPRSAMGTLACVWRGTHLGDHRPAPPDACPVTDFIAAQGLNGTRLDRAHRALHVLSARDGPTSARYRTAAARFQDALARLVGDPAREFG